MFHFAPTPGRGKRRPKKFTFEFLGQFIVIAIVIVLFVLYVAGAPGLFR
jgi:hypothetical protein